ncbi:hypothetical protein ABL142_004383 [Salmonella enterica]|nr:hypothetical protein [Salmonella enterica subsp. enterica serovar Newport]ELC2814285.1 hypothetical protein [Salmonella enterica]
MRFLPRLAGGFLPRFTAPLLVLVVRVLPGYPFRMEYHRETVLRPAARLSAAVLVVRKIICAFLLRTVLRT